MYRLLTAEQEAELRLNGENTDGGDEIDPKPVVKLFAVNGSAIWLLTELSPFYEGMVFGLCDLGEDSPEIGNVFIPDIEGNLIDGTDKFSVEKDENFTGSYPLSVFTEAVRMCGKITRAKRAGKS